WLGPYLRDWRRRTESTHDGDIHVLICFADHFEPKAYGADKATGLRRVRHWVEEYPRQFGAFRDSDGRPPRYSFFFPIEEYEPESLDPLADLCRPGFGEVAIALHLDRDSPDDLRRTLPSFQAALADCPGPWALDKHTGESA